MPYDLCTWNQPLLQLGTYFKIDAVIFSGRDSLGFFTVRCAHSVEITEIYSHIFLAKISWNQRLY